MGGRRVVFALGTVFIFLAPANARDDEVEERKATCDREATACDALDFKAYVATAHEQVILFGIFPPFALEGIEPYRQRYKRASPLIRASRSHHSIPNSASLGTSGWPGGHDTVELKPKNGPVETYAGPYTFVYTKMDWKWFRMVVHASPELAPPVLPSSPHGRTPSRLVTTHTYLRTGKLAGS